MVPDPEMEVILAPLTLPVVAKEKLLVLNPVIEAPKVAVYCTVAALVVPDETSVMELMVVGAGVTVKVVEGPAAPAVLPALSEAVPAAIEIPNVPVPEMEEIVTVRVVLLPDTAKLPVAVPVVFSVIFEVLNVLVLKLASA